MTRTLAQAVWDRGRWVFAGVLVLAVLWLHIGVVFPRPTQTLVIRSEIPLHNVSVTMDGTELDGRYGAAHARTIFAWTITRATESSLFVLTWSTADGRAERLERWGSYDKQAVHCLHSLRVNAEGRAGAEDWMTVCRCDPTPETPYRTLSQGECL